MGLGPEGDNAETEGDDGNGEGVAAMSEVEDDGAWLDDSGSGKYELCVLLSFILCAVLQKSVLQLV